MPQRTKHKCHVQRRLRPTKRTQHMCHVQLASPTLSIVTVFAPAPRARRAQAAEVSSRRECSPPTFSWNPHFFSLRMAKTFIHSCLGAGWYRSGFVPGPRLSDLPRCFADTVSTRPSHSQDGDPPPAPADLRAHSALAGLEVWSFMN